MLVIYQLIPLVIWVLVMCQPLTTTKFLLPMSDTNVGKGALRDVLTEIQPLENDWIS